MDQNFWYNISQTDNLDGTPFGEQDAQLNVSVTLLFRCTHYHIYCSCETKEQKKELPKR